MKLSSFKAKKLLVEIKVTKKDDFIVHLKKAAASR